VTEVKNTTIDGSEDINEEDAQKKKKVDDEGLTCLLKESFLPLW
jgi:hypothetical protein